MASSVNASSTDWEKRYHHVDQVLDRPGPRTDSGFSAGEGVKRFLREECKVLVIGAGGLGCEILANLALSGFRDIHVIDMDTIDISNLNRQFLFRPKDVGQPKATVAAEFIMKRVPGVKVTPYYGKIQDKGDDYYMQFNLVICGLDSVEARRWINATLVNLVDPKVPESLKPLIDGGTEGFKGQARVILPTVTSCYECSLDMLNKPTAFPICTIANTPRLPEHCIEWASVLEWPRVHGEKKMDTDDPEHISWLYNVAAARAKEFKIEGVTWSLTQGVVKNIIPAIASTNAIIAASCCNEAFKIATSSAAFLNNYFMLIGTDGVYSFTFEHTKRDDCPVCGGELLETSISKDWTVERLIEMLVEKQDIQIKKPSLSTPTIQIYFQAPPQLEEATRPNLEKKVSELVEAGDISDRDFACSSLHIHTSMDFTLRDSIEQIEINIDRYTKRDLEPSVRQIVMDLLKGKFRQKKDTSEHKFWATQPVPQSGDELTTDDGYIEPAVPPEQVRQDPYPLPKDFVWSILDINDANQSKEVYDLLSLNYVEDGEASLRFQYTAEFLQWALKPPGYHKEWHIGVRVKSNNKLVAFISGVPINLRVRGNMLIAAEINYLCVHKKLRSKRLAPVLIREVTRQCHLKGVFQAIYTAGVVLPTPVATCRYYHRSLNISKLVDVKFTYVPRHMTLARMIRLHKLPETPHFSKHACLREMEEKDLPDITALFKRYMQRFDMAPELTIDEARHHFLSGQGEMGGIDPATNRRKGQVVWSYVVEDTHTHKVTDFFSFYSLPSNVINNPKHGVIEAAYLFYYASEMAFEEGIEENGVLKKRLERLIGDALIIAQRAKFDVFNALTLMDTVSILKDLKFGAGDGFLNFYLYNWRTAPMAGMQATDNVAPGKGVGVVML